MEENIFYVIKKGDLFLNENNEFSPFTDEETCLFNSYEKANKKFIRLDNSEFEIEEVLVIDDLVFDKNSLKKLVSNYGSDFAINNTDDIQ